MLAVPISINQRCKFQRDLGRSQPRRVRVRVSRFQSQFQLRYLNLLLLKQIRKAYSLVINYSYFFYLSTRSVACIVPVRHQNSNRSAGRKTPLIASVSSSLTRRTRIVEANYSSQSLLPRGTAGVLVVSITICDGRRTVAV